MLSRRAVFVDKDGTVIEDVPFNCEVTRIRLMPRAAEGLRVLRAAGYAVIIVSNQAGVAQGLFTEHDLRGVEIHLRHLLAAQGVPLAGFYCCPHHPDGRLAAYRVACGCRKPGPGLLLRAASDLGVDLARSWMIGDILHDIEAGRRAGCRTVLLDNGHETEWRLSDRRTPHDRAPDLLQAATRILSTDGGGVAYGAAAV